MPTYSAGEVVLADLPFSTGRGSKVRPCLVVADTGDEDVVLARITTQPGATPFDVPLSAWQQAGLLAPSVVRVHKLASIHKGLVIRRIGPMPPPDRQAVATALRSLLSSW